jgi:pyruvate,water dikinase
MDLTEADKLQSGEVLVCPSTAPPWTPLFAIACAVVTDSGGVLSHSAIAAREYGIPAVVGTMVGTHRIPDGATVTVDGAQGIVRIEE